MDIKSLKVTTISHCVKSKVSEFLWKLCLNLKYINFHFLFQHLLVVVTLGGSNFFSKHIMFEKEKVEWSWKKGSLWCSWFDIKCRFACSEHWTIWMYLMLISLARRWSRKLTWTGMEMSTMRSLLEWSTILWVIRSQISCLDYWTWNPLFRILGRHLLRTRTRLWRVKTRRELWRLIATTLLLTPSLEIEIQQWYQQRKLGKRGIYMESFPYTVQCLFCFHKWSKFKMSSNITHSAHTIILELVKMSNSFELHIFFLSNHARDFGCFEMQDVN